MKRKRILIIHSDLFGLGGAELVACKIISLLQHDFDVTFVHCGAEVDPKIFYQYYKVQIDSGRVRYAAAFPSWIRRFVSRRSGLALLKYALALRYARKLSSEHDLIFSSYGECPLEHDKVIQYIHIPLFSIDREIFSYLGVYRLNPISYLLRSAYVILCRFIAGWEKSQIRTNTTIVNSEWTGTVMDRVYGVIHSTCVYPPTLEPAIPLIPFHQRENGFVMLGRMHPSKRIELGIQIIDSLRKRGHDIHLHLVGKISIDYHKRLKNYINNRNYIHLHVNASREDLEKIVVQHRYGIHCYKYEHFGLAPAEMKKMGSIVFVPDYGGQVEVIHNIEQRYSDLSDAVTKIEAVLLSESLQTKLRETFNRCDSKISLNSFEEGVLGIVQRVLNE